MSSIFIVDSVIRIPEGVLTSTELDLLKEYLTFANPIKERAAREQLWNWRQIPDQICLFDNSNIPRGMAHKIEEITNERLEWDDRRVIRQCDFGDWDVPFLRPHQEKAVASILVQ